MRGEDLPESEQNDTDLNNWSRRLPIAINHKMVEGDEVLEEFPARFQREHKDFAQYTQDSGGDFLFTAEDNVTKLPHEIRNWNPK